MLKIGQEKHKTILLFELWINSFSLKESIDCNYIKKILTLKYNFISLIFDIPYFKDLINKGIMVSSFNVKTISFIRYAFYSENQLAVFNQYRLNIISIYVFPKYFSAKMLFATFASTNISQLLENDLFLEKVQFISI